MINFIKSFKSLNQYFCIGILFTIFCLLPFGESNVNYAKIINPDTFLEKELLKNDLSYSFDVAGKLKGIGSIDLVVKENNIEGIARSNSTICNCKVDFLTELSGEVDKKDGTISMKVNGTGSPKAMVPGKVNFQGPLKGKLNGNKLTLSGKVKIKGWLADYAGFENFEDLIIEISDPAIVHMLKSTKSGLALLDS